MKQAEKIALKEKVTASVTEAFEAQGFEVADLKDGVHIEVDGMAVVISAVVKSDTFDLAEAKAERAEQLAERQARAEAKADKAAAKEAKLVAKQAKATKE